MRIFLISTLLCGLVIAAGDTPPTVWPEIDTAGRKLINAKVTKVKPDGLQILHDAGMETIPWHRLPQEVKMHYQTPENLDAAMTDAEAEAVKRQQNAEAARWVALEKEAQRISEINGMPIQEIRQALQLRDWCLANPQGSKEVSKDDRDAILADAREVIEYRPEAPPTVYTVPVPPTGGNSLSRGAPPQGLGGVAPVASGRSMKDHPERRLEIAARRGNLHAAAALAGIPMAAGGIMESHLAGPFEGFRNGRVFRLQNGTLWEQQDFTTSTGGGLTRKAMILTTSEGTFLQLDGDSERVKVRQVR